MVVRLAARAAGKAAAKKSKRVTVAAVAPEIGLDVPIVEIEFPYVCEAKTGELGMWRVRCTPKIWHPLLEAWTDGDTVVVKTRRPSDDKEAPPLETKQTVRSPGRPLRFENGRAHVRSLEENRCPPGAPERTIDVALQSPDATPGADGWGRTVILAVPGSAPFAFARYTPSKTDCVTGSDSENEYRFSCGEDPLACSLAVEDDSLRFTCTAPAQYSGSVLLPCGARGRFRADALRTSGRDH